MTESNRPASTVLFEDQTDAAADNARQILARLWTFAQTLEDDQSEAVAGDLVAVYDQVEQIRDLAQKQMDTLQDAAAIFTGTIAELRTQRNNALDDLQSVRRSADQQARTDIARDLALELDIGVIDAQRLIAALLGRSEVPVSGYTMMDLRDNLRRLLEEITDELVCNDAYEPADI